jgi:hypothetical protein
VTGRRASWPRSRSKWPPTCCASTDKEQVVGLCVVQGIDKLHQVRSALRSDDEEDDNAATMSIPHGSFDLMGII